MQYIDRIKSVSFVRLVLLTWISQSASATEINFVPGDAFFHGNLSSKFLKEAVADNAIEITYSPPLWFFGSFGGFAGFDTLQVNGMPEVLEATKSKLRTVLNEIVKDSPEVRKIQIPTEEGAVFDTELTGFHMFVCGKNFDIRTYRIGLKYNERWVNLPDDAFAGGNPKLFEPAIEGRYFPFIKSFDAVVEDWRNASDVDGLKVNVPKDISWGVARRRIKEPVTCDIEDVIFIIVPNDDLEPVFQRSPGTLLYKVDSQRIIKFSWNENGEYLEFR